MNTEQKITAYKAFNEDLTCRGYQFTVGKVHQHEGEVKVCQSGFHSCTELKDVYNHYPFDMHTPVYKVEIWGDLDEDSQNDSKIASRYIKIVKEVTLEERLSMLNLFCNSNRGSDNLGSHNRGSHNLGSRNRGSDNRGSDNLGSYNLGSHNLGTKSVGFLNTVSFVGDKANCYCFNKPTGMSLMAFAKKYLSVLKELKIGIHDSASNLPNYDKELFEKMRIYI